jgi:transposase-like protein
MKRASSRYRGYRFPAEIISYAVAKPGKEAISDHHGQTEELLGCSANDSGRGVAHYGTLCNNRVETSHQPTRQRERYMRRFKSARQAQRFLSLQGVVQNLFRVGRHLLRATNYRLLRSRSFSVWQSVTA